MSVRSSTELLLHRIRWVTTCDLFSSSCVYFLLPPFPFCLPVALSPCVPFHLHLSHFLPLSLPSPYLPIPPPPLSLSPSSEQESEIAALKASKRELEVRNESLFNQSRDMQEQLAKQPHTDPNTSSSSSLVSSGQPSITHITATLDLDLSKLSVGTGNASHATAVASAPLQFDSQYRSAMEQGL